MSDLPNDVDAGLRRMGYDPEELGKYGARLAKLLIDNAALRAEVEALKADRDQFKRSHCLQVEVTQKAWDEKRELARRVDSWFASRNLPDSRKRERLALAAYELARAYLGYYDAPSPAVYKDVNTPAPAPQNPEGER